MRQNLSCFLSFKALFIVMQNETNTGEAKIWVEGSCCRRLRALNPRRGRATHFIGFYVNVSKLTKKWDTGRQLRHKETRREHLEYFHAEEAKEDWRGIFSFGHLYVLLHNFLLEY